MRHLNIYVLFDKFKQLPANEENRKKYSKTRVEESTTDVPCILRIVHMCIKWEFRTKTNANAQNTEWTDGLCVEQNRKK